MALIGGNKWERVTGPNLQPQHIDRGKANKSILNSDVFKKACAAVGIEPSRRQASKFKNKRGIVRKGGK